MATESEHPNAFIRGSAGSVRASCGMTRQRPAHVEPDAPPPARCQVICVASGKGGTGKSFVAANLSVLLARKGLKVTLVDADFGLANAHLLLGIEPKHDIHDVLSGELALRSIIERGPAGIQLVPGGSGRTGLPLLNESDIERLLTKLSGLEDRSDIVIVDLAAGITPNIMRFLSAAHDIVLVSNHESTARADVISTINLLAETLGEVTIHLVINSARDRKHATVTFQQLWRRVGKLHRGQVSLFFSGWIPKSPFVTTSVMRGKPMVQLYPQSTPTRCLENMCLRLHKHHLTWRSRQIGRWAVPSAFAPKPVAENAASTPNPSFESAQ